MWKPRRTYLDWASAAPPTRASVWAFGQALRSFGNPSAPHHHGREARSYVEEARVSIARLFEVKPDAIIFTSGSTEANALALMGSVHGSGKELASLHILYLPTAHSSSVKTIRRLGKEGVQIEELPLKEGAIDIEALRNLIRPETFLISLDVVCGETGTRYDSRAVQRLLQELGRSDVLVHADASQLPAVEPYTRARLGADLITLDAQKVGGIRGVGLLMATRNISISPLYEGGGQERGLRSGTEPSALQWAFASALTECERRREEFVERARRMRTRYIEALGEIPDTVVNEGKIQAPHIVNVSLLERDTDYLVALLDKAGFSVSTKSSCETDSDGSRVILKMTGDSKRATSTLRVSWGADTKEKDLERFIKALKESISFLDANRL